jgi:hypothetical protein
MQTLQARKPLSAIRCFAKRAQRSKCIKDIAAGVRAAVLSPLLVE